MREMKLTTSGGDYNRVGLAFAGNDNAPKHFAYARFLLLKDCTEISSFDLRPASKLLSLPEGEGGRRRRPGGGSWPTKSLAACANG
jgi:hypothetical protein